MGFSSVDCVGCGHPILHAHKTNAVNAWMNVGVAITPAGGIISGFYDGYGRLDQDFAVGGENTVWHEACWVVSGSPTDHRGPSPSSADQGWFFPEGAHTIPEPVAGGYEVTTVTADGCDSSSGEYASYLDAVGSLKEACEATGEQYGGIVESTLPIDGHGIIYSIDLLDGEPVLTVHYRYHITPVTE